MKNSCFSDKNPPTSPNRTDSISSSGRNSPSLIILDSDSPASTPTPTPTPARTPSPTTVNPIPAESSEVPPEISVEPEQYLSPSPHFLDVESESTFPVF